MGDDLESLVGRTLAGRYRVVRSIGSGGMGAVFEAEQTDLGRRVALKVLFDADPRAVARFRQEALAAAKLRSPHVVTVTELVDAADGAPPFLVMELLDGEPLSRLLARSNKLPPERAVDIAVQLLAALADAHEHGIVHRDVKPANVFLVRSPGGRDVVKLLDFGVAKLLEGGVETTTGAILGTRSYLAPEQIIGRWPVGPATDLHAVGVVLYEMIAGARPWAGKDDVLASIAYDPAPRLEGCPAKIADGVARALAKEPAQRFPSAEAMIAALGSAPRAAEPDRRIAPFAIAFGVTIAVAGAGFGLVARRAAPPLPPPAPPPAAVDASPVATSLPEPEAAAPEELDASEPAPEAGAAKGPLLDGDCICVVSMSGGMKHPLCAKPQTPSCYCESKTYGTLCPVPQKPDGHWSSTCGPGTRSFDGPDKKTGDPCTGFRYVEDGGSDPATGLLECWRCYKPTPRGAGVAARHGTLCTGYDEGGQLSDGHWECLVRRR